MCKPISALHLLDFSFFTESHRSSAGWGIIGPADGEAEGGFSGEQQGQGASQMTKALSGQRQTGCLRPSHFTFSELHLTYLKNEKVKTQLFPKIPF